MRDSRPQLLDVLFDNTFATEKNTLYKVQQRAIALQKLNHAIQGLLPAQLQPWCRVANYRQSILVLETANASWMMRLRYEQPNLLSALRAQILPSLSSIDIKINPALMAKGSNVVKESAKIPLQTEKTAPLRHLSQESAEELKRLASRSPEKLRNILEKLASLAEGNTNSNKFNNR